MEATDAKATPTPETDKFPKQILGSFGNTITTYFSLRVSHERLERALSAALERAEKAEALLREAYQQLPGRGDLRRRIIQTLPDESRNEK